MHTTCRIVSLLEWLTTHQSVKEMPQYKNNEYGIFREGYYDDNSFKLHPSDNHKLLKSEFSITFIGVTGVFCLLNPKNFPKKI